MDGHDSRIAHSPEASTDERASSATSDESPAAPDVPAQPFPADRRFATAAEEEAYWAGVRIGAETALFRTSPARRILPDTGSDLTRGAQSSALVSSRLAESDAGKPSLPARAPRHDGWNPDKERLYLTALAATGVVADACRACGMSRDAAYARRNSAAGRAFAIAWDAALVLSRAAIADDVMSRARHGVIDKVYRNGELVAERHRHDNRLAMAVLTRLDRLVETLAERAPAAHAAAAEFDLYLDALSGGDGAAQAFLAGRLDRDLPPASNAAEPARCRRHPRPDAVCVDDLDPDEMDVWTEDQLDRAEASGILADLHPAFWPAAARNGEADGTDGMCKLRKLYLRYHPPEAEDWWPE